ncbi:hypothetical protein [Nocardioides pantholopis]|uniref:hypothetical protein n=1 Tax=Nocardioides pantholopis TaxID=2483798 RepID=UPI000F077D82|nr:hypothetical protein [Nocardioides pantholopis]
MNTSILPTRRTARRTVRALAAAAVATALLAGCGDDSGSESADPTPSPTESSSAPSAPASEPTESTEPAEPEGATFAIKVTGDKITPNGELIDLAKGEPLTLTIDSDRAGELHVHAKPEQFVEFDAGTSTHELVIDTPGVAEIEEHDSGIVIAQLQVK